MHGANGSNGRKPVNRLNGISTEGFGCDFGAINEPHQQAAGHVIHLFTPEQAARIPEHPAAKAFPKTESHIKRLESSIRDNGQQQPVILFENQLLDGRCRVEACGKVPCNVLAVHYGAEDLGNLTPLQWVVHRNRTAADGRRLTDAQFAVIVAKAYGKEQRELALLRKKGGVELPDALRGETSQVLGGLFGVSQNLVKQALALGDDEELTKLILSGQLSLSKAAEIARMTDPAQRAAAIANRKQAAAPTTWNDATKVLKRTVAGLKTTAGKIEQIATNDSFQPACREPLPAVVLQINKVVAAVEKCLEFENG